MGMNDSIEERLEKIRNRVIHFRKFFLTMMAVVIGVFILLLIYGIIISETNISVVPFMVIFFLDFFAFFFFLPRYSEKVEEEVKEFPQVYKHYLIENVMKKKFPDLYYNEKKAISMEVISKVLSSQYLDWNDELNKRDCYGEDYIIGSYKSIEFCQSDIYLFIGQTTENNAQRGENQPIMGTLTQYPFPKSKGMTVVLEYKFFPYMNKEGLTRVNTESIVFNKIYNIYATDEHTALYILTPALMEHIMLLEHSEQMCFRIEDGVLYALKYDIGTFEINLDPRYTFHECVEESEKSIKEIMSTIDILQLESSTT